MKKQKPEYKIVRRHGLHSRLDKFYVYRRSWFFWKHLKTEWSQGEAEQAVKNDKAYREMKRKKPEVVGYY